MKFTLKAPALPRVAAKIQRLLESRKQAAREALKKKAGATVATLYKESLDLAPSPQKITSKVKSLGWHVRRKPGRWPRRKGEKNHLGAMNRMQAFVIAARVAAIDTAASGWVPAMRELNGGNVSSPGRIKNPRGSVRYLNWGGDNPAIVVTNDMPGAAAVEKAHDLIPDAIEASAKPTADFINRSNETTARAAGF